MRKSTKYLAAVAAFAIGSASPFMVAAQTMQKPPARLADVMSAVQFRHSKLWTAGQQKNWELAGYELKLVKSSLNDAIALYTDIPVENITMIDPPIKWIGRDRRPKWRSIRQSLWRTDHGVQFLPSIDRPRLHRHDGAHGVAVRQSIVCATPGTGQGCYTAVRRCSRRLTVIRRPCRPPRSPPTARAWFPPRCPRPVLRG